MRKEEEYMIKTTALSSRLKKKTINITIGALLLLLRSSISIMLLLKVCYENKAEPVQACYTKFLKHVTKIKLDANGRPDILSKQNKREPI